MDETLASLLDTASLLSLLHENADQNLDVDELARETTDPGQTNVAASPDSTFKTPPPPAKQSTLPATAADDSGAASKRTVFTRHQLKSLEARFRLQSFLSREERREVAEDLGITERQVMVWFQNRRGRLKKRGPADKAYNPSKLSELNRPYPILYGMLSHSNDTQNTSTDRNQLWSMYPDSLRKTALALTSGDQQNIESHQQNGQNVYQGPKNMSNGTAGPPNVVVSPSSGMPIAMPYQSSMHARFHKQGFTEPSVQGSQAHNCSTHLTREIMQPSQDNDVQKRSDLTFHGNPLGSFNSANQPYIDLTNSKDQDKTGDCSEFIQNGKGHEKVLQSQQSERLPAQTLNQSDTKKSSVLYTKILQQGKSEVPGYQKWSPDKNTTDIANRNPLPPQPYGIPKPCTYDAPPGNVLLCSGTDRARSDPTAMYQQSQIHSWYSHHIQDSLYNTPCRDNGFSHFQHPKTSVTQQLGIQIGPYQFNQSSSGAPSASGLPYQANNSYGQSGGNGLLITAPQYKSGTLLPQSQQTMQSSCQFA